MTKPQVEILRAIAGLPDDDWQPEHWAVFTTAQDRARREVDREDRAAARRTASRKTRRQRAGRRSEDQTWVQARQWACGRAQGRCEARCAPSCAGRGAEAHHRRRRSQGGSDELENLLWVCAWCHTWIHEHPAVAYEKGWLLRAGDAV